MTRSTLEAFTFKKKKPGRDRGPLTSSQLPQIPVEVNFKTHCIVLPELYIFFFQGLKIENRRENFRQWVHRGLTKAKMEEVLPGKGEGGQANFLKIDRGHASVNFDCLLWIVLSPIVTPHRLTKSCSKNLTPPVVIMFKSFKHLWQQLWCAPGYKWWVIP
jgi:hypothetical protein